MTTYSCIIFDRIEAMCENNIGGATYLNHTLRSEFMIGDQIVKYLSYTPKGDDNTGDVIVFEWYTDSDHPVPHGHHTDVLVIDNSKTYFEGKKGEPVAGSPKDNYPSISMTVQGPEGYSLMDMERLSCRYMQYGSNYSDTGTAKIVYKEFIRSDAAIGSKRILMVGDRIDMLKADRDNPGSYIVTNYELQSYEVDAAGATVSITYGMPFLQIGDVLYNMMSNSGMSILPSDS